MITLRIRKNFNQDLGMQVYTIERTDGQMLFPVDGIKGLNYSSMDLAKDSLARVQKSVNNGAGSF